MTDHNETLQQSYEGLARRLGLRSSGEESRAVNLIPNAPTPESFYAAAQEHVAALNDTIDRQRAEIDAQRDLLAKTAGDLDTLAVALDVGLTPRETLVERCTAAIRKEHCRAQTRSAQLLSVMLASEALARREGPVAHGAVRAAIDELRAELAYCPSVKECVNGCRGQCRPDPDGAWPMPLACAFTDACPDGCRGVCQTTIGGDSDGGETD